MSMAAAVSAIGTTLAALALLFALSAVLGVLLVVGWTPSVPAYALRLAVLGLIALAVAACALFTVSFASRAPVWAAASQIAASGLAVLVILETTRSSGESSRPLSVLTEPPALVLIAAAAVATITAALRAWRMRAD